MIWRSVELSIVIVMQLVTAQVHASEIEPRAYLVGDLHCQGGTFIPAGIIDLARPPLVS